MAIIKTIGDTAFFPVGTQLSQPEKHEYSFKKIDEIEPTLATIGSLLLNN
jgi:hypothetical protein